VTCWSIDCLRVGTNTGAAACFSWAMFPADPWPGTAPALPPAPNDGGVPCSSFLPDPDVRVGSYGPALDLDHGQPIARCNHSGIAAPPEKWPPILLRPCGWAVLSGSRHVSGGRERWPFIACCKILR
jgi:hypothetical protein